MLSRVLALIIVPIENEFPKCNILLLDYIKLVLTCIWCSNQDVGCQEALALLEIPVPSKVGSILVGSIATSKKGLPSSSFVYECMRSIKENR